MRKKRKKFIALLVLIFIFGLSTAMAQWQKVNPLCYGASTGSLSMIPDWGTPPYSYLYSTGDTTQTISSLAVGSYWVKVTDKTGFDSTLFATLTEPLEISQTNVIVNSDCDGHNNGAVTLTSVTGGSGSYSFEWREVNTDSTYNLKDLSGIRGGKYDLKITDDWGCIKTFNNIIVGNNFTVLIDTTLEDYVCNGHHGNVDIRALAAAPGNYFKYSWNSPYNTDSFTSNDSIFGASTGFLAGKYVLIAESLSSGCAAYVNIQIDQSLTPMVITPDVHHNLCSDDHNGSISLQVSGGDPRSGYECLWLSGFGSGSTSFNRNDLPSGVYQVRIVDQGACVENLTIDVFPNPIVVGDSSIVHVLCHGAATGEIALDYVRGGFPPYSYLWNDGQIASRAVNLTAGVHTVIVTDNNNCRVRRAFTISEPFNAIKFFAEAHATSCKQSDNGWILLEDKDVYDSPYANYLVLYNSLGVKIDSVATGNVIGNLSPGTYPALLINENGCTARDTLQIESGLENCIFVPNIITPNGDAFNDFFEVRGACAYDYFEVNIFTPSGISVYSSKDCSFKWDGRYQGSKPIGSSVFYYVIVLKDGIKDWTISSSVNIEF